jgi:hypothetical protein
MRHRSWPFVLSGLLAAAPAPAAIFTVGADGACTHGSLLSAISAAATNGPALDEIRLATNLAYNSIIAPIAGHSVIVRGGYSDCADPVASGRTTVRGTTAGQNGTFATSGTAATFTLELENLELREGGNATRRGGALRIEGEFGVTLRNTVVTDNFAARGGGIYIDGSDGAGITIDATSIVSNNIAGVSGGGVYCQDGGRVLLQGLILANTAQDGGSDPVESGNGGGVALYGCAMTQQRSTGFRGVLANTALRHGGGYYVRNGGDVFVTGDSTDPAKVTDNVAGDTGGGIAVNDQLTPQITSSMAIGNAWVERNRAPTGAGIGLVSGGNVSMFRTLASATCHDATYCSSLSLNEPPAGGLGFGCAAFVGPAGELRIYGTRVEENCESEGGWAFRQRSDSILLVESSVVANNGEGDPFFIDNFFSGELVVAWSTIAGHYPSQRIGMFGVAADGMSSGTLRVYGTILAEPFQQLVVARGIGGVLPPMTYDFDCLVVPTSFTQSVTPIRSVEMAAPYGMVNPAAGNFRLASGSALPVDWCDASRGARVSGDADGVTTLYDAPRPNQFGAHDVGAYEFVVPALPDPLFANGFE